MRRLKFFLIAITIIGAGSCTPVTYDYTYYDDDMDELLTAEEFEAAYTDIGYYNTWDLNDDGILDENEWATGISNYYGDYDGDDYGVYDDWDLDNDGYINDDEFVDNNFAFWDTDDDGFVDEVEYDELFYDI